MKSIALILALVLPHLALANDGGIVGVEVKDLKLETVEYVDDTVTRKPIDLKQGQSIEMTFKGNVSELMKYLPGSRSVIADYGKHVRTLAIAANEGFVTITCEDAEVSFDQEGKESWKPKTPNCTISLNKYTKPVEDEWVKDLFGDWQDLEVPRACRMK